MSWKKGRVTSLTRYWEGCQECYITLEGGEEIKALAYTYLVGQPSIGDLAILTTSALKKNLGTGGYAFIVALPEHLPSDEGTRGHIVKTRYTPLQYMTLGVDEQESPYHHILKDEDSIQGMPVIVCELHSMIPAAIAAIKEEKPDVSIAYIMLDGASLPLWFSRLVAQLEKENYIDATISCGQAYGGTYEAVNIYTALLAARHVVKADIAIVTQGPGTLGTGTQWGFSGTQVGEALNAVGILKGTPIALLRMSSGDKRERHQGISHHTMTTLSKIVHVNTACPVPHIPTDIQQTVPAWIIEKIEKQMQDLRMQSYLHIHEISAFHALEKLRSLPFQLSTMGRNVDEDPLAFMSAYVAGIYACSEM
ncbi:MAG: DUF3866 family protein [Actinomycetaceae bacterium]|nr:DUF3866 family protein [Actinomycetaceae bacterium]